MIEWLKHIGEVLSSFFDSIGGFITSFVDGLKQFFGFLSGAVDFVSNALKLVPTIYYVFGVITISILIALMVAGRNAGGD